MTDTLAVACHAKVNLFLRVLAREADGYHGIETLFCRVALHDTLEVTRTDGGIALHVEGADVGPVEENLAWRGADAILAATGRRFGVSMRLTKRIPAGGGLGGGSSDAAQALHAVNRLANNAVPRAELLQMGARIGADVTFFASEASLALGWGHGQRLLRLPPLPSLPMLLVIPDVRVPTASAYQWVDEIRSTSGARGPVVLDGEVVSRWGDVARLAGNDFEAPVFGKFPAIRAAFEALAGTGPLICRMSGSGSTIFAVYRNTRDRDDAQARLGRRHGVVVATEVT